MEDTPNALTAAAERAGIVRGFLFANRRVKLPDETPDAVIGIYPDSGHVSWYLFGEGNKDQDQKSIAREIIRAIGGTWNKGKLNDLFEFTQDLGGNVVARVVVDRSAVCNRRVTGTREVTRTIPAQDELTVTETVEDYEWDCMSILDEEES